MNYDERLFEMVNDPQTVDFIVRRNKYLEQMMQDSNKIVVAQILSGRYALCYANINDFPAIAEELGTSFISAASIVLGTLDRESLEISGIIQVQSQPYLDLTGSGVLIGFVDTGIDYTLDVFRYEDGTSKIYSIYDQTTQGTPPEGFPLGAEYTNAQINEALRSDNPLAVVPEQDTSGHGTFLASVAAGRNIDDHLSAAPDAEIIAVKLRRARPFYLDRYSVPAEQQNAFESSAVMVGVEYIIDTARRLNKPVVICLGLGSNFGSHDGFSLFEEYLSGISNLNGVCICNAAGNESQARHHMQGTITTKGETQNIDIRVGDNAGDIYITIWNGVSDRMSIAVRSPTGELVGKLPAKTGQVFHTDLVLEKASVHVEYFYPLEGSGGQISVVKLINATPGIWTITLYGDIILKGDFHAWLPMTGFVSPTVEFLSTTPYYTVTIPATMIGSICCGAYNMRQNSLYAQSSWGPTVLPSMAPDLVAPGVAVGGYFPDGYGKMDGTSVASAITAGACALMLQWGIVQGNDVALSTYQIRAFLIRGCKRSEAMTYPNTHWGYGALDLMQTFNLMREL